MDAIKGIRSTRSGLNVPPSKKAHILAQTDFPELFTQNAELICKLASGETVELVSEAPAGEVVTVVTDGAKLYMPLAELVDLEAERARRGRELSAAKEELGKLEAKLQNPGFVSKAPEKVVAAERERLEKLRLLIQNLEESFQ
jgi:valyl-tRNA synthetase